MTVHLYVATCDERGELDGIHSTPATEELIAQYEKLGKIAFGFDGTLPAPLHACFVKNPKSHKPRIRPRPEAQATVSKTSIKADGKDEAKISGVPSGSIVTISDGMNQQAFEADGEVIVLTAETPARYVVHVDAFPQMPFDCEIVAQ